MTYDRALERAGGLDSASLGTFRNVRIHWRPEERALWYHLAARPVPCFTLELLEELSELQRHLGLAFRAGAGPSGLRPEYLIATSGASDGACLGGDLGFFVGAIERQDAESLRRYASLGIDVLYRNYAKVELPVTTVALLRGPTLGAGLEAALSCDFIIAERDVRLGFPEVLFNMFPGMGAYSFLARRISPAVAERMLLQGRLHTAEEMLELGVVDHVVEPRGGEVAVSRLLARWSDQSTTRRNVVAMRNLINPVSRGELDRTAELWVEAALALPPADVERMRRLNQMQLRKVEMQGRHRRGDHKGDVVSLTASRDARGEGRPGISSGG